MNTKKKPLFRRTQGAMYRRLKNKGWRRPDGKHNKIREGKKGKGEVPSIGYGAERSKRHLHPSGFEEVMVYNIIDIQKIDPAKQAARISAKIGKRKKEALLEELKNAKIKVLNP
jgi:large subunit ribosomal protein L32e